MGIVQDDKKRKQKTQLYTLFSQVAEAIANPHRLELLDLLAQAPRMVEELAQETGMSIANASQHLQRLKRSRLVVNERQGTYIRYRLASPDVARLWINLRTLAEQQLGEVEQALNAYRDHREQFEKVTLEELQGRLKKKDIVLLDVRPVQEYRSGHLPGAISMPLIDLGERMDELPKGSQIAVYCRGPYCVYADQALELLSEQKFNVARLEEGVIEWQEAGYALEV